MALSGVPRTNVWVDRALKIAREADQWLQRLVDAVNRAPLSVGSTSIENASATTSTTAIPTPTLVDGLYRVSYSLRITQAATVSSSATPTIGWTSGGVSCSQSGAALTGNTTATQQNAAFVINVDASTTITYAVAYASVGATAMTYSFDVIAEALP